MNDAKYIGLDVHQATISVAVLDSTGKLVMEAILETKPETILAFIHGLRGSWHGTFDHQRSHAGDESPEGDLPKLGHPLFRQAGLRTAPSCRMGVVTLAK